MGKTIYISALLLVFAVLFSGYAYSSPTFDVSIDRTAVNGKPLAQSSNNLIEKSNIFSVVVDFTALAKLEKGHIEATLRGIKSGDVVSNSTGVFDLDANHVSAAALNLALVSSLARENEFELKIKIVDATENSEQKTYLVKTKQTAGIGALDVSIDRVKVNSQAIASSRINLIGENDNLDILVEFTALESLKSAHIDAVLRDLANGNVIADSSPNFDLASNTGSSKLLKLHLPDKFKKKDLFELQITIVNAEGVSVQKLFELSMQGNGGSALGRALDASLDTVQVENKFLTDNENNFIIIGENKEELDIRVRLTALEKIDNARLNAILTFENGDVAADTTSDFDVNSKENTVKRLKLPLISKSGQSSLNLRLRLIDVDGNSLEKSYGLRVSRKSFPFTITGILLNPEDSVQAGKLLSVALRFKNTGVATLEGASASVSIPELGISSTKLFAQVKGTKNSENSEMKEEFTLKIFDDAAEGDYTLRAEIFSKVGEESEIKEVPLLITGKSEQITQAAEKLSISVPVVNQNIAENSESIYPLVFKNNGQKASAYTVLLDGQDWASLRLSDSNTFVIKPAESKTVYIYASSNGFASGEQTFLVTILKDGNSLKQVALKSNVAPSTKSALGDKMKISLEIGMVLLVVLLVGAGFFFGIRKYTKGNKESNSSEEIPESDNSESYY